MMMMMMMMTTMLTLVNTTLPQVMKKKTTSLVLKDLGQGHQVPAQGHLEVLVLHPAPGHGQDQRTENGPDTPGLGPGPDLAVEVVKALQEVQGPDPVQDHMIGDDPDGQDHRNPKTRYKHKGKKINQTCS